MRMAFSTVMLLAFVAVAVPSAEDVYAQGKAHYDAKRYAQALEKFDEAARLEPTKARWQYNRGLALRKLKRDEEAREAFLESLRLDPTYKQAEIREKLGELSPAATSGEAPAERSASDALSSLLGGLVCLVGAGGILAFVLLLAHFGKKQKGSKQKAKQGGESGAGRMAPGQHKAFVDQLHALGQRLTQFEHAMSRGEDAEARQALDRAHSNFQQARKELARAKPARDVLEGAISRASAAADVARDRFRTLHGDEWSRAKGPAAGCFFCARPLPTPESAQAVTLKLRGQQAPVAACQACARIAASGQAPNVATVKGRHWASVSGLDPYVFAYSVTVAPETTPAWKLGREAEDVASFAGVAGAAAVGVAAGVVAARVLDLDAASMSAAAVDASAAAARSAASRKSERDWRDNS